jgi:hypothetical protein
LLNKVGLPVDVFHFECKHSESDEQCQEHCNPASFPELIGPNNEWIYNSSAAEQVNAWFGGFQGIVREMLVDRYNFFLDEMIAIRNRYTRMGLERRGAKPHLVVFGALVGS